MLQANISEAGYGKKVVLNKVSVAASTGEIVALIGPNGAGKSTLLKALMGIVRINDGQVVFESQDITNRNPEQNVRAGISFIPQGNRVFGELSVRENLEIGGYLMNDKVELAERIQAMVSMFPFLYERMNEQAGKLSGGEKQQLALARALVLKPKLLLMDEPSLGLSPRLVRTAMETVQRVNRELKTTVIIVEQKVHEVLAISTKVYALRMGEVAFSGPPGELREGDALKKIFLV